MADEGEEAETEEDGEEEGDGKQKAGLKKKLLFIGLPIVLILVLGTVGAFVLMGGKKPDETEHAAGTSADAEHGEDASEEHHAAAPVYYELPEMYANIVSNEGENAVLKLVVLLEVDSEETVHLIEPLLPRIVDRYQGFLRELRMDDVKGSAGYYRLKLELLRRVNLAVAPVKVNDLTIDSLLVN